MTILHIEAGKNLYGGAKQVAYLIEELQKRGTNNILICPINSEIAKVCKPFCIVEEIQMSGDLDISMIFRIKKIIKFHNANIVHVHSRRGADIMGMVAAKLSKTPVVLSRRVDNPEPKLWAKFKYSFYDHIVTISEAIRNVLISEGVKSEKITTVYSAVDSSIYDKPCSKTYFLQEFKLPENTKTIGVIAQLIPRKGHKYLLQIVPDIIKIFPNLHILFFGKGPIKNELEDIIKTKNLQNNVHMIGFRDDLLQWIGCLDLVVHPALMEGLGVSLLQAAAAGVPIIASPFGGMPEIVHNNVNGFLVDPHDSKTLFEKISLLLNDQNLSIKFGKAGKEIVKSKFSIESMVDGNLSIYKKVLS
ncbi:glycosyltransferase family 4 protein [Hydrogenimonas thermophila]|uniref:Glycosyltransferase involved in cell wall bisynthesis n=1 Tax=Hydrogenimonas thermophila TaxID=223786 RepID=A0A1I5U3W5_9BACT|nr:glycosyltransferase family 4 protein [Hydrogenimonas thermophila]SFP89953.1 Glycosyltransferase involved in cell wall bisynthesis [Hydrogenimonas thermophila]